MKSFTFLALFLLPLLAYGAGAEWPITDSPSHWVVGDGIHVVSLDSSYIFTRYNYNNNGATYTPWPMNKVEAYPVRLHGGWGWNSYWSVYAQISTNTVSTTNLSKTMQDGLNFGLGDAFLATRLAIINNSIATWIAEFSWNIPLYLDPSDGQPALGNQSHDLTAMSRLSINPFAWFSFGGYGGYTYRSDRYSAEFPYGFRGDLRLFTFMRLFAEYKAYLTQNSDANPNITTHQNTLPGGSYLYQSPNPTQTMTGGGAGIYLDSHKEWEIVGGGYATQSGQNAAQENIYSLGIVYHDFYELIPRRRIKMPSNRENPVLQKRPVKITSVYDYDLSGRVEKMSSQGNFIKINLGSSSTVQVANIFHIFPPVSTERSQPLAIAEVVAVREDSSFLRINEYLSTRERISEGFEVRRVLDKE